MGSNTSKSVAQNTIRKFPNRAPGAAVPPPSSINPTARNVAASRRPAPSQKTPPQASYTKDEAIREDGFDPDMSPDNMIHPDLARRLQQIGVVQPNPTYSPSSTASPMTPPYHSLQQTHNSGPIFPSPSNNLVLSALEARERIQREADEEFDGMGLSSSQGRRFLHPAMIRDILIMRQRGASHAEIEHRFNLKSGVVSRLGPKDLYQPVGDGSS